MMLRYLLLISLFTLSACQSNQLVELDYQLGRDYHSLQTWQWAEPAVQFIPDAEHNKSDLDAERVRSAIAEQLTQQGLQHKTQAQLQVRAWLITEIQQQRTEVMQSDYWGGLWGPSIRSETYDTTYSSQKLQIDLIDSATQALIWRGSDSWVLPKQHINPAARQAKLRQQVQRILQNFPPQ